MRCNESFKHAAVSILLAGLLVAVQANADDAPVQSKHQMMKDCMTKQKASEGGRPKEEMKKACKDLIKTEKQNAAQASAAAGQTPHN